MAFCVSIPVRTYELDSFGHVNNSAYLNYLEAARSEYLKEVGLSFHDFATHGAQLVIVEATVRYLAPARYGDVLLVQGRFTELKAASLTIEYVLTREADGTRVATGSTRAGFIDAATGKPQRMTEPFKSGFAQAVHLSSSPVIGG